MSPHSRFVVAVLSCAVAQTAFAVNVVVNPDFDNGTTAWSSSSAAVLAIEPGDGTPTAPSLDLSQQPPSGIARVVSDCIAISASSVDFIVRAKFAAVEPAIYAHAFAIFYPTADCSGATSTESDVLEWRPPQTGWVERSLVNYATPGGTQSAHVYLRSDSPGPTPGVFGHMLFDHIRLGVAGSVPVELQAFDVD
jgi:hypothetical protein